MVAETERRSWRRERCGRAGAWRLLSEHVGPELHELGLVETAVAVRVEHAHHGDGRLLVDAHQLLDHVHHFLRTQHAVPVLVQLREAPRYLVVPI